MYSKIWTSITPMHRFTGLIFSLAISLVPLTAAAQSSMLSYFPEDIAAEQARNAKTSYQVASISTKQIDARSTLPPRASSRLASLRRDAQRLYASPPTTLRGETDLACTAIAVFFEARGESIAGQKAVASVVLQRALTPERWGRRPCEVVRPVQFSFMTTRYGFPSVRAKQDWRSAWGRAIDVAANILSTGPMPELNGADHYHANYVHPDWRLKMPRTAVIGRHYFYADPDSKPTNLFQ